MAIIEALKESITGLYANESRSDDRVRRVPHARTLQASGHQALRSAIAILRTPQPIAYSDCPDRDFVALVRFYDSAIESLIAAVRQTVENPSLRKLINESGQTLRASAVPAANLDRTSGAFWILDGASVQFRFVHNRLCQDLGFPLGYSLERDFALVSMIVGHSMAELARYAANLCREPAIRVLALATEKRATALAVSFREWLWGAERQSHQSAAS